MNKRKIYQQYRFTEVDYKTTGCRLDWSSTEAMNGSFTHLKEELYRLANMYNKVKRKKKTV